MTDFSELLKKLAKNQERTQTINNGQRIMDLLKTYAAAEMEWLAFNDRELIRREMNLPDFPGGGSMPQFTKDQLDLFQRKADHYVDLVERRLIRVKSVASEADSCMLSRPTNGSRSVFLELASQIDEIINDKIPNSRNKISIIGRTRNDDILSDLRDLSCIFYSKTYFEASWLGPIENYIVSSQRNLERDIRGFQKGVL